ncbi:hypothetical protein [Brevibacillus centrosporus]|uniref:hypothetical protein n=1 Tax=Brevibacillus centrosporus TaxID=54910 RepID=UPI003B01C761
MLYFVEDHVPRSSDFEEIAKVDAYKREYGKKGIYATYEPSKIVNHLYAKVSNLNKTPVLSGLVKADDGTLEHSKSLSENKVNSLILSGLLTRNELLILGYILDTGNRSFGFRWMSEDSKLSIQKWEQEMLLASDLKNDYNNVIENLAERELLIPKEHTGYGNERLYVMPLSTFNDLRTISEEAKGEIAKAIKECSFPF